MQNPFTILNIAETADDDAIKKAYLQQVREHPPERDSERFQAIRTAYEMLKTRRDRLRYRLFQQKKLDPVGLMATALQPGPVRRLTEQQFQQWLSHRFLDYK